MTAFFNGEPLHGIAARVCVITRRRNREPLRITECSLRRGECPVDASCRCKFVVCIRKDNTRAICNLQSSVGRFRRNLCIQAAVFREGQHLTVENIDTRKVVPNIQRLTCAGGSVHVQIEAVVGMCNRVGHTARNRLNVGAKRRLRFTILIPILIRHRKKTV